MFVTPTSVITRGFSGTKEDTKAPMMANDVRAAVSDDSEPASEETAVVKIVNQAKAKGKKKRKAALTKNPVSQKETTNSASDEESTEDSSNSGEEEVIVNTNVPTATTGQNVMPTAGQIVVMNSGPSSPQKVPVSYARAEFVSNTPVSITEGGVKVIKCSTEPCDNPVKVIKCTTDPCDNPGYRVVSRTGPSSTMDVVENVLPVGGTPLVRLPNSGYYARPMAEYQVMMHHGRILVTGFQVHRHICSDCTHAHIRRPWQINSSRNKSSRNRKPQ